MKNFNSSLLSLFLFVLLTKFSFSQNNNCGNNAGFEDGTTAGWICKYGCYGLGPCPKPVQGACPAFLTSVDSIGCITGRHTIVDTSTFGTGIDPNSASPYLIHTVPPGGGHYAFRLGDEVTGGSNCTSSGTCIGPGCYARAEAIRLTFVVNSQNASFTYRYAAFLQNGGHLPEEQPRFEVLFTLPNMNDSLIGYRKVVANNSNPYCPGVVVNMHSNGSWLYTDWTDIWTDLSNYMGQTVAVEFRTSDCFPGPGITDVINGVCTTTTQNGISCVTGPSLALCPDSGKCTGTLTCNNQPGSHSAYAYIDAYCSPVNGINELANNTAIRIYPNPMTSSSIIEINGQKEAEIVIYDMLGKEIIRKKLTANKTEIHKGDLERGVYFVRVKNYAKKLIVD